MKISEEQVRYVADLANLSLSETEVHKFQADLNEIDTTDVEPMAQVLYDAEENATWREDGERPTLGTQAALANAPQAGDGYFKVPKVIER